MTARRKPSRKPRRNGIAAALRFFEPKIVPARKGAKAYRRKPKHRHESE